MKKIVFITILFVAALFSCNQTTDLVVFETNKGIIKIQLYEKTTKHRENFKKLASEGFYDNLLFHRVINEFMIQGGDPESADRSKPDLGTGGPGYTLDAEIYPEFIHKKGAVAAARLGNRQNPERKSSGSQFYIVTGTIYSAEELEEMLMQRNELEKQRIMQEFYQLKENRDKMQKIIAFNNSGDTTKVNELTLELQIKLEKEYEKLTPYSFTPQQIEQYTTVGGTPFLDGEYTVFGEVTEGMEVVESISVMPTNQNDRPTEDVIIEKVRFE